MSSSLANAVSKYAGSKTARAALNTNFLRAMVERGDVFKLPDLQYGYSELEPFISAEIMELHHSKHHQAYINNLKVGMEKYLDAEAKGDKEAMAAAESAIAFNGGGHENHSIFWKNLAPPKKGGGEPPAGALADAIASEFGSFEDFKKRFNAMTAPIQGSGWGWLGFDPFRSKLTLATCPNQDVLGTKGLIPLLGIDVWEHAYYLQYKSKRPDYLEAVWSVVNFKDVAARLEQAKQFKLDA